MARKILAAATMLIAWAVVLLVAVLVALVVAGPAHAGEAHAAPFGETLPVTGGDIAAFFLGGLALLIAGAILFRLRRRLS